MTAERLIFVGFELTDEVSAMLNQCAEANRVYLDDPTFLETVVIDDVRFLGKRTKDAVALDRIEDTARSVVSLLKRINPAWDRGAAAALVMAVEDTAPAIQALESSEDEGANGAFDYLGLID